MCNECQMSQIFIIHNVKFYLIRIVYKTWHDLLHHFSGEPVSTSSLTLINVQTNDKKSSYIMGVRTFLNLLMEMVCWFTCAFRFNIHDLFVYFFTVKSTTASQITTCFYLLMQITCWLHVFFLLLFMIYLFTSSKWSQQQHPKSPPVFIYLCK